MPNQHMKMLLGWMTLILCAMGDLQADDAPCNVIELPDLQGYIPLRRYGMFGGVEGYRAWGSHARPDRITWYTFGWPWLQRNSTGQVVYETTPTEVKLGFRMLSNRLKEALLVAARRQNASQNPTLDDVKLMPLSKVICTVTMSDHGDHAGRVKQFITQPFSLDFALPEDSPARAEFLRRLDETGSERLTYWCTMWSTPNNNTVICDRYTMDEAENLE